MPAMGESRNEVEIKLAFDSAEEARARLDGLAAKRLRPRELEDNRVYDTRSGELERTGLLLRLRTWGGRSTLTFKAPASGPSHYKVRIEDETEVRDPEATHRILTGLGFDVVYRYQKYRSVYSLDEVEVSVDETPIGCWIELEGEPQAIDRAAARLGFGIEDYVRATYRDLHRAHAGARGLEPGHLVFAGTDAP